MAQWLRIHLPVQEMQEMGVSLGRNDPLDKEVATHSRFLAWKIPWAEGALRLQYMGSQRVRHNWATVPSIAHVWFQFQ